MEDHQSRDCRRRTSSRLWITGSLFAAAWTAACTLGSAPTLDRQARAEKALAETLASEADFIITDELLAEPPTYEDFETDPVGFSICIGEPLRIANASRITVGLVDTPDESDNAVNLGIVLPNGVFTIKPEEIGTFFISAAGTKSLLFRYEVRKCGAI